jgi:flagellum-specific peptidoglycan hydrolase FlgJ
MTTQLFQLGFYYYRLLHPSIQITARTPLAQAVLESANFTSHVFDVNQNCMGMMAPQSRETTATNKGGKGYASYGSVLDGIADIFYFCEAFGLTDDAKYDAHIKAGRYATDKAYYGKVERVVAELQAAGKYLNPAAIYGGVAASAVAVAAGAGYAITKALS